MIENTHQTKEKKKQEESIGFLFSLYEIRTYQ